MVGDFSDTPAQPLWHRRPASSADAGVIREVDGTLGDVIGLRDNINTCCASNSLQRQVLGQSVRRIEPLRLEYTLADRELRVET